MIPAEKTHRTFHRKSASDEDILLIYEVWTLGNPVTTGHAAKLDCISFQLCIYRNLDIINIMINKGINTV
jgi:hypothetical protein